MRGKMELFFFSSAPTFHSGVKTLVSCFGRLVGVNCGGLRGLVALQVEKKTGMESLRATSRPELLYTGQQKQNQGVLSEEAGWFLERGNLVGEGFSVDDLLNLGEFAENEMEAEEDEAGREFGTDAEATHNETERSSSPSSSSSGLTFELPPPPPLSDICLPVSLLLLLLLCCYCSLE